jgi:hypothetical protein
MKGQLNKILPVAGLFCGSLVFSPVFADTDSDSDSMDSSKSTSSFSQITPPAGFAAASGIGFSIYADFIYWEARQANLEFVTSGVDATGVSSQGQVYYPSFKYKPGFKVGLAADLGHDNWDLTADYTWLNGTGGKNSVSQAVADSNLDATNEIVATLPDGAILYQADGNWGFHYNLINLDLGRNYYISEYLTLRPYFGLSGAWNNQSSLVHYTFADTTANTTGDFLSQDYKQNYWGVGFSTGLNTCWCFDENWSIYGDFGVMNLWSRFKIQESETQYDTASGVADMTDPTVTYNTEGVQYGIQNVIDLQMGIRWGMRFDNDNYGISFQAGWDQQVWINHAQYPSSASNLSIQGLDIRARFDF